MRNYVRSHWGRSLQNFGDCLQPYILKHYGLQPVYTPSTQKADVLLEGSILQSVDPTFSGYIIGTGGDSQDYSFPEASVLALRGQLTRNNFSQAQNDLSQTVLGDPGLLMSYIFQESIEKRYILGIVPHFVDLKQDWIISWTERFGEQVLIISPLDNPVTVIKKIKSCKHIVSSSLHGLIISDSFHIPNCRIVDRRTMPTPFYDYKFEDYYSSLSLTNHPFHEVSGDETLQELVDLATNKPYDKIEKLKSDLDKQMKLFATHIKEVQRRHLIGSYKKACTSST